MELIAITGAGVVLYCGWLTAKDELRCWRRYRAASGKTVAKGRMAKSAGYHCSQLTVSAARW